MIAKVCCTNCLELCSWMVLFRNARLLGCKEHGCILAVDREVLWAACKQEMVVILLSRMYEETMYIVLTQSQIVQVQEQLNDRDLDRNDNKNRRAMEDHATQVIRMITAAKRAKKDMRLKLKPVDGNLDIAMLAKVYMVDGKDAIFGGDRRKKKKEAEDDGGKEVWDAMKELEEGGEEAEKEQNLEDRTPEREEAGGNEAGE